MPINIQDLLCRKSWASLFLLASIGLVGLIMTATFIKTFFLTPYIVTVVEFNKQRCVIKGEFELMWIHSVEKQWWIEAYKTKGDQLLLTDTYLQTFGAGTPSTEALGASTDKYPNYVHYRTNIQLPELNWMISSNIEARIIVYPYDETPLILPIYQWVDDYSNIYISARKQNLWTLRQQETCNDYDATANTADIGLTTTSRRNPAL